MKGKIFGRGFLDLQGEAISDSMVEASSCRSGEGGEDGLPQESMMKRKGGRIDRLLVEETCPAKLFKIPVEGCGRWHEGP
jgi:hypothetical protein